MRRLGGIGFGLVCAAVMACWTASAAPVIESLDRFELNWSTMRIKFYGEAVADFSGQGFDGAEKMATDEGLLYALRQISQVRQQKGLPLDNPRDVANDVTKQAFVSNTTYFSDGRVRVELESSLARALDPASVEFKGDEPTATASDATGIVLQVSGVREPGVVRDIRSQDGAVLFSPKDVARSAFRRHLTGRWFFNSSSELRGFSGANPIALQAEWKDGSLILDGEVWSKLKTEHPRLIEEARLAYVLPRPARPSSRSPVTR